MLPIGLASDHAGFELKQFVKKYLDEKGMPYRTMAPIAKKAATTPTLHTHWQEASKTENAKKALPSAVAAKAFP